MPQNNPWEKESLETITITKHVLSNLSVKVRTDQFNFFEKVFKINSNARVLDVGVTSDETLKDSNMFEKLYRYPEKLTVATIENPKKFNKIYPKIEAIKIVPHDRLPFKDNYFDIVVSWATLEHVGDLKDQEFFLNEIMRVGKKVFLTTPYRGCIYEPHSGFFFVHWLPLSVYRYLCRVTNKKFWSFVKNLNPLYVRDIFKMKLIKRPRVVIYKMFNILPSHLIIYKTK